VKTQKKPTTRNAQKPSQQKGKGKERAKKADTQAETPGATPRPTSKGIKPNWVLARLRYALSSEDSELRKKAREITTYAQLKEASEYGEAKWNGLMERFFDECGRLVKVK
jgi:hypothetical protein